MDNLVTDQPSPMTGNSYKKVLLARPYQSSLISNSNVKLVEKEIDVLTISLADVERRIAVLEVEASLLRSRLMSGIRATFSSIG